MRRLLVLLAIPAILLAAPVVAAGGLHATFPLNGSQEVPSVSTAGTGNAVLDINAAETQITYSVTYSGLTGPITGAHLHLGARGANGGVLFALAGGPSPSPLTGALTAADLAATGDVSTFAQAIDAIKHGRVYVNIHTAANPGGEIRGQVPALLPPTDVAPGATAPDGAPSGTVLLLVVGIAGLLVARRRFGTASR